MVHCARVVEGAVQLFEILAMSVDIQKINNWHQTKCVFSY